MLSINWRRGLFRIWIAASLVWLIGAGAILQEGVRRDVSALLSDVPQPVSEREELTLRRKLKQGGLSPRQELDIRRRLETVTGPRDLLASTGPRDLLAPNKNFDFAAELRKSPAERAEERGREDALTLKCGRSFLPTSADAVVLKVFAWVGLGLEP